ncbi:MAG: hypothetical protein IJ877_03205 [Candidatus Gastranaerophilales bacterium]|nr:hypothetical protein [Candidatus Gastranaerophilales bacterium]
MYNVNFLGLTSQKQNFKRPETAGSIAYNAKPQLFKAVPETAGSVASTGSSSSTGSSCGSTVAIA